MSIELNERPAPFAFVVSESDGGPFRSRDAAKFGPNLNLDAGTVLAAVGVLAAMTAAAAADAGNAGNGTLAMDGTTPVLASAKNGAYRVVFNAATTFTVEDPAGKEIGKGQAGAAFAKDVKFTITAGGTAFVAGDAFSVVVGREAIADEVFVQLNPAGTDGSQIARAIAGRHVVTGADGGRDVIFNRPGGEVRGADLIWPVGITAPQKAEAIQHLRGEGIKLR